MATLPPPDVAMDISSPGHRVDQDDDIEIDISDYPIAFELTDDEQMVDGELARPDTATDENMDDDEPINPIHEEVMTDEPLLDNTITGNDFDDELIDYDDDHAQQTSVVMAFPNQSLPGVHNDVETFLQLPPHGSAATPETAPVSQQADGNSILVAAETSDTVGTAIAQQNPVSLEHVALPQSSAEHDETAPATVVPEDQATIGVGESLADSNEIERPAATPAVTDSEATLAQQQQHKQDEAAAEQQNTKEDETEAQRQQHQVEEDKISTPQQKQIDDEESLAQQLQVAEDDNPQTSTRTVPAVETRVSPSADALPSPSDTGLHPIMVKYRSTEFPLFKSRMALNGLLESDNIVNLSLSELMATCREQLGINTGEKISDDQELCLKIDHMRSTLREHEPRAFEFSLQDVLNTFVQLHQNDGIKDVPAMWLTIELTWNFSKLAKEMRTAAADGYGMSNFEYVNSANEDYYQNDQPDEVEHDQASVEHEYYEPDEEYADEFEEDEAADHVDDNSQSQGHSEPQDNETREVGATGGDESDAAFDESVVPAESDQEPAKHVLVDLHHVIGSNNDNELPDDTANAAVQVETEGSPVASANILAASNGDANDSAYAASNTEVQSTNHEKHVSEEEEAVVEVQSDNEFDDAAEVYDAIGEGDSVPDEIDGFGEFDEQQEASYDVDHSGEAAGDAAVQVEDADEGNTLHADSQDAGAEHEGSSTAVDVATMPEPEQDNKGATETVADNDDLIEYDDDEPVLLETTTGVADEESGAGTNSVRADATPESKVTSQLKDAVPKHQSPRGKRRLEDDSDFDFIDFADEEPDVKKARAG
jgi:hypothetical protein